MDHNKSIQRLGFIVLQDALPKSPVGASSHQAQEITPQAFERLQSSLTGFFPDMVKLTSAVT
jgi:hypothetical protein